MGQMYNQYPNPNDMMMKAPQGGSNRGSLRHSSGGMMSDPRGLHQGGMHPGGLDQGYHHAQGLQQTNQYHHGGHNLIGSPAARESAGPVFDMNDFPALGAPADKSEPRRDRIQSHQPVPHINSEGEFPSLGSNPTTKSNGPYNQRSSQASSRHQGSFSRNSGLRGESGGHNTEVVRLSKEEHAEQDAAQLEKPKPQGPCMSHKDLFALKGLLQVIRMTDPDLNTLALGMDLTGLAGLNLNSTDVLYPTFASPWAEAPMRREPDYELPYCYYMQPPALKTSHLSKFRLETLFYIFYNMPRDTLQVYAAKELYNREWSYHKDLKVWVTTTRDPKSRSTQPRLEYFDFRTWERRVFNKTWPNRDTETEKQHLMSSEAINNL